MFETIIDVYHKFNRHHLTSITIESAGRLSEPDCRKVILEYGIDLGLVEFDFVSMRKYPSLPYFLQDEFKMAEQKFHARLKSR